MVSTPVSEEFMLYSVKLLTAIFTGEVLSVFYPMTPLFSSVQCYFFMSTLCLNCLGAKKSSLGCCWAQELQIVPGSCRFGTLQCNPLLTLHALKGVFQILSSSVCSLFIWILCMIFISMKSSPFFLCQWFIFSFVLWLIVLTWLARRENNGGVVLKKLWCCSVHMASG